MALENVMGTLLPILTTLIAVLLGGGLCCGLAYFLFVVQRRKKWLVDIWEQKADGKIYIVAQDTLIQKKYNKGKQTAYLLKNQKVDIVPPPIECVHRYRKNEFVSYLRVMNDYIPLKNTIVQPDQQQVKKLWYRIQRLIKLPLPEKERKLEEQLLDTKYIYAPLNKAIVGTLKFEPMDYDLSVQMTNSMESLDKIYKDQTGWWEKYGGFVAIGVCVVLCIVTLYFSYGYGESVIKASLGAAEKVVDPINKLVNALGATSGTPPA